MTSLLAFTLLAAKVGLTWSLDVMINESLVTRARNGLIAKAMANEKSTHIMFIDSDISFQADSILHMIAADKEIIGGAYPKKSLPIQYNINLKKETKVHGPVYTVDTAATGFLLIKREVIQNLMDLNPQWKYIDDINLGKKYETYLYSIFDCYIDKAGHYLSEDWAFCRRAQELGYAIWIDSRVKLNHTGTYIFEGDVSKLQLKFKDK